MDKRTKMNENVDLSKVLILLENSSKPAHTALVSSLDNKMNDLISSLREAAKLREASRRLREMSVQNRAYAESVRHHGKRVVSQYSIT